MEENTRVTIRLPVEMVKQLQDMIAMGKYDNLSEAIRDCIQEYLDSHPDAVRTMVKKRETVDMETLIDGDYVSMDDLIRKAAKKYTKDHLEQ